MANEGGCWTAAELQRVLPRGLMLEERPKTGADNYVFVLAIARQTDHQLDKIVSFGEGLVQLPTAGAVRYFGSGHAQRKFLPAMTDGFLGLWKTIGHDPGERDSIPS